MKESDEFTKITKMKKREREGGDKKVENMISYRIHFLR